MSSVRQFTVRPGFANVVVVLAICTIGISLGVYVIVSLTWTDDWKFITMITGAILLLIVWPLIWLYNLIRSTIRITNKESLRSHGLSGRKVSVESDGHYLRTHVLLSLRKL